VPVVSDQLGVCASRTATRPARSSCSAEGGTTTDPAPKVVPSTQQRPGYFDLAVVDLIVANRVAEYRPHRRRQGRSRPAARSSPPRTSRPPSPWPPADDADITGWQTALAADTDLTRKLTRSRGWLYATMRELEPGVDRGRITIPVPDDTHRLVGLLATSPGQLPAKPRCSPRQVRAGRCFLTPPPNHPSRSCLSKGGQT